MFSSDSCCFRNGQLKQLKWWRGMGKAKIFYTGQNAWKIYANHNENIKKLQKTQPLSLLYTIFPFRIPSINYKWCPFHKPCLKFCIPFDCCKCTVFFYIEINLKINLYTDVDLFFFSFLPTPLDWRLINPLRFIFYHLRSTNFEEAIAKTERFLDFSKPYHSPISPIGLLDRP